MGKAAAPQFQHRKIYLPVEVYRISAMNPPGSRWSVPPEFGIPFRVASYCPTWARCIHHQFGIGEDFALVVDEWESVEQFQQFFADPNFKRSSPRRAPGRNRRRSSRPRP